MAEDIAGIVRRFYDEVISQGKLDLIDELVAPDFVEHQEFPGLEPNRDGLKKFFAMWRQAFPDARASIDLLAVQGDLAAVYGTGRARTRASSRRSGDGARVHRPERRLHPLP